MSTQSLWRNRDYMCWWSGTALSQLGSNMSLVAFPLLVLFGGGTVFDASVLAAAERAGALVSRLWGGAIADRCSRRAVLIVVPLTQAVLVGAVAVLVHAGTVLVPVLAGIAFASGVLAGAGAGVILPAMRRLVPREQFAARAAQEQGLAQATQLAGSPLAGLLFAATRWLPFGLDSISFAAASAGAALIRTPLGPDRSPHKPSQQTSALAGIREGLRVVARDPFLRYTTVWVAVGNLVGNNVILMGMALLKQDGVGSRAIGFTNSVVLAGGVIGAVLTGRIMSAVGSRKVFVAGTWVYVVSLGCAAVARTPWQFAIAASVFVFASVPTASVWEAYTAAVAPDRLFGRVGATTGFISQSLVWAATLASGALADAVGAPVVLACFAALLLPLAVANHRTRSLGVLRTPLAQVPELPLDAVKPDGAGQAIAQPVAFSD